MATTRSTGFLVTAAIWNALFTNISDAGAIVNPATRSVAADATAADTNRVIICTAALTLTLYAVSGHDGYELRVINDSSGDVVIDGNAAETIGGQATVTVPAGGIVHLYCNGTKWFIR